MDAEIMLENWCVKKGIDIEKIPEKIIDNTVARIEDDFDEFIREHGQKIVEEWAWMNIEQELKEHPEWKLKDFDKLKSQLEKKK